MRPVTAVLLAATLAAAWIPAAAAGQNTQGTAVGISATVVNGLTVLKDHDLDFGKVAVGSGLNDIPITSSRIVTLQVVGGQNRQVTVTLAPPAALLRAGTPIPYTWGASYNESANTPTDATTVAFSGTSMTFRLKDTSVGKNLGRAFVWLYGSINVGAVPMGSYTATFVVTAAY